MSYQNIVVAIDLGDECMTVVERARSILQAEGQLLLVHVAAAMPMAYGAEMMIEQPLIQHEQMDRMREQLYRFAHGIGIDVSSCRLEFGDTRHEIHRVAREENSQLIVVGSHGRHGLALLLGSTANEVLHGSPCDVLAVRLHSH